MPLTDTAKRAFRALNKVTTPDTYPLPRIDEILDSLSGREWFTVLDSRSAYWAVPLHPADRPKTAFIENRLSTVPSTSQRTMNVVLASVLGRHTLAYLDDVVVASSSTDHLQHLRETLDLLECEGMKLILDKCEFATSEVRLLGFVIGKEGVCPNPEKVAATAAMRRSRSARDVHRFIVACGFFRRHGENFAAIARSLTRVTKRGARFEWDKSHAAPA